MSEPAWKWWSCTLIDFKSSTKFPLWAASGSTVFDCRIAHDICSLSVKRSLLSTSPPTWWVMEFLPYAGNVELFSQFYILRRSGYAPYGT